MKWRRIILLLVALCSAALISGGVYLWFAATQGRKFQPQINAAAKRYNVDPLLVKAVIWRETRFHPDRRGRAGEIGLMQIQEAAALDWAVAEHVQNFSHEQCFDPGTNVLAGTFYLGKLMKRYARTDDPLPFALADYNAGRGHLLKWNGGAAATNSAVFIGQIGFPNTRAYVRSIMRRYAFYKFLARLG
ncbi:MAG TPA: lytic transglycosylase domain-containing protein [Verrucomicrobiae bacterium]|nr:lytic transglycosylase domain-containing protein [Verrucomicrobiae bacterium]